MKIAVVSDTHLPRGARRLPVECLRQIEAADLVLHCGDFVAASVLDDLRELAPVEAVRGNMDDGALQSLLPERRIVEAEGVRIGMVHIPGPRAGRAERLAGWFPGCAAIVYGHTHEADVTRLGDVLILNPGSPTERRRAPARSMLLASARDERLDTKLLQLGS